MKMISNGMKNQSFCSLFLLFLKVTESRPPFVAIY